jgi:hypothetical protein
MINPVKTIQIKGASEVLRLRLEAAATANFRSMNQEALARLERSFELEDALVTERDQQWIDEALAGKMRSGSIQRLRAIARKARAPHA